MATTSILTGTFTLPNNAAPESAVLSVTLSAMDTDQNTRHVLPDDGSFTVALVSGAIPAGQEIWKNTAGPRGTHYRATLAWTASDGRLLSRYLGSFQVGEEAEYDMADLLDQPPIATLPEGWYSTLTQAQYDAAITARDEAVAAALATAADRVQTGLDATATAADRVQTGLDRTATGADRTATAADRLQTGLDRTATGADRTATAADRVQTGLDRTAAALSAALSAAYAQTPEDTEVPGGSGYSALHYAAKAGAAAAVLASMAVNEANTFVVETAGVTFPLAFDPGDHKLLLTVNGVVQTYGVHYTIAGDDVTFSKALLVGDRVTYLVPRPIPFDPNLNRLITLPSRAALVSNIAEYGAIDGETYFDGEVFYLGQSGATDIVDLPGLVVRFDIPALTDTFAPTLDGDLIFNVPSQYPTIQAAVDAALRYVTSGHRLEVRIASGHALTHGIRLVGAQASGIKITSVDAVVPVAPGFVPVDSNEWPESSHALAAFVDTDTPLWNILVDLTGTSGVDGMMVFGRSRAQVGTNFGVNNASVNLEVRGGAEIVAPESNWNGAAKGNIRITSGARAELRDSTAHDGWQFGAAGISSMYGSVLVSRGSVANLQGIKIYRPRASAITVRRSFISMKYADIQELSYGGFITTGAAIHIHDGSIVSAATVTVDGVPMTRLHTSTGLIGCMTEDGVIFDGESTGLDSGLMLNDGSQKAGYSKVLWGGGADADPATFPGDGGSRYWPSFNLQRQRSGNTYEVRLYFQTSDGRNLSFVRTWGSDNVMRTARYLLDNDLTTTATDSTAGLVLKTGDAGILGRIDTPNIDLDAEYFGFWGNSGSGSPPVVRPDGLTGNSRWAGLTLGNQNSRLQLARRTDASSRLYVRSRDDAAWSDWSEILTDNDLTATATDSSSGRILKTGDAGVLGRIDTPNIDLDAEYFGFWGNSSTSAPPVVRPDGLTGNSRWAGLTLGNANSRLQLARRTDASSRLYVRSRDHAAWSDWSEILTAARILSSIASTPAFVGQQAFVNGVEYRAFGIASTADWVPVASANRSGTTANRPTTQLFVGRQYFDTDLNKPIWRNAANSGWVDATGATV